MASKTATAADRFTEDVKTYAKAIKLVGDKKFSQAEPILNSLVENEQVDPRLSTQAKVYLKICGKHDGSDDGPKNDAEELYDYGVFQHNQGLFDDALQLFEKAVKKADGATDHIAYARAAAAARAGQEDNALMWLGESINAESTWRFRAQQDPDFAELAGNSAFEELVQSDDD